MPPSILIVDDEPALNELFVVGLRKYGFLTEGVLGGEECLQIAPTYQPDLIILDMMMEPMDGWETLMNLKHDLVVQDIPVIMQTGKNLTYKEAEQYSFYIEDYVMKPITPKKCIDHINDALEIVSFIKSIFKKGISLGYSEDKIHRFCKLHRAISVSRRLEKILKERYGSGFSSSSDDSYGSEDYAAFLKQIENEYNQLKIELSKVTC